MDAPWQAKARIIVERPVEAVWRAWSELEALTGWYAPTAAGDLVCGSQLVLSWNDLDVSVRLDVEAISPPHHLALAADLGDERQRQSVRLVGRGAAQTLVEVTHRGGHDHFLADGIEAGWRTQLELLRLYLECYAGEPRGYVAEKAAFEAPFDSCFAYLVAPELTATWLGGLEGAITDVGDPVLLRHGALRFPGVVLSYQEPFEIAIHFPEEQAVLRARQIPLDRREAGYKMIVVELSLWGDPEPGLKGGALIDAVRGASARLAGRIHPGTGSA